MDVWWVGTGGAWDRGLGQGLGTGVRSVSKLWDTVT